MEIKDYKLRTIGQLQNDPALSLLVDSQDAADLRKRFPEYDAFFVKAIGGGYTEVWGFVGIVPYLSKLVAKLV
jgi:hypothetical protein